MAECIFCRIAEGSLPATIVYDDGDIVAFRDISPQAPTHIVLIPRKHIASLRELVEQDDASVGYLVRAAARLAQEEHIAERGYRLVVNCGREAGQTVDHLHFHLLGGRALEWPPG
jgi:histidine triad (HIT) family protein